MTKVSGAEYNEDAKLVAARSLTAFEATLDGQCGGVGIWLYSGREGVGLQEGDTHIDDLTWWRDDDQTLSIDVVVLLSSHVLGVLSVLESDRHQLDVAGHSNALQEEKISNSNSNSDLKPHRGYSS